jgi:hypothetical protein
MLRIPHCLDNRLRDDGKTVRNTHRPSSTPPKHYFLCFWYSFLLEAEWTPGPIVAGRVRLIEEIHSDYRISNPRPSGLQHCALTTTPLNAVYKLHRSISTSRGTNINDTVGREWSWSTSQWHSSWTLKTKLDSGKTSLGQRLPCREYNVGSVSYGK